MPFARSHLFFQPPRVKNYIIAQSVRTWSILAVIHQSSVSHQPSAFSISHQHQPSASVSISNQPPASATICSSTPNEGLFSHCRASSAHSSPPHVFIVVLRCSPIPSMHKECCASAVLTPFISFCVAAKIRIRLSAFSLLPCDPPFEPSPLLGLPFVLGCFPGWPPAF